MLTVQHKSTRNLTSLFSVWKVLARESTHTHTHQSLHLLRAYAHARSNNTIKRFLLMHWNIIISYKHNRVYPVEFGLSVLCRIRNSPVKKGQKKNHACNCVYRTLAKIRSPWINAPFEVLAQRSKIRNSHFSSLASIASYTLLLAGPRSCRHNNCVDLFAFEDVYSGNNLS